jgi:hypothetical protein
MLPVWRFVERLQRVSMVEMGKRDASTVLDING